MYGTVGVETQARIRSWFDSPGPSGSRLDLTESKRVGGRFTASTTLSALPCLILQLGELLPARLELMTGLTTMRAGRPRPIRKVQLGPDPPTQKEIKIT